MDIKVVRAHVAKQRTLLREYEGLEQALVEIDSLLGQKGDLERACEAAKAKLAELEEQCKSTLVDLTRLKGECAEHVDRAQKFKQGLTGLQQSLQELEDERARQMAQGADLVKQGIDATLAEYREKARVEIASLDAQIRAKTELKDQIEQELDQTLGRIAMLKGPDGGR